MVPAGYPGILQSSLCMYRAILMWAGQPFLGAVSGAHRGLGHEIGAPLMQCLAAQQSKGALSWSQTNPANN